jgi:hypothetical protein
MLSITIILWIVLFHYIFDFVFQPETWAINKSKSFLTLNKHVGLYGLMWLPVAYFVFKFTLSESIVFAFVTYILHLGTDYISSKIVSKKFANKQLGDPIPNLGAFSMIGLDQVFHYFSLFSTYYVIYFGII